VPVESSVDVVAQEQVVCVRYHPTCAKYSDKQTHFCIKKLPLPLLCPIEGLCTDFEELHKVVELAMNITTDCYWGSDRLHV
jgi:hypothetical protein